MKSGYKWLLKVRPAFVASFLKKVFFIKREVVETKNGFFYIDPISNFGNALITDNTYEADVLASLTGILRTGDTFIDLGANEGFFSIVASRIVGETGKVVCIEPQTRLQSVLTRNIKVNNAFNVQIYQRVISDSAGIATLSLAPDTNTGSSGLFKVTKYNNPTEDIIQMTLSNFLGQLRIDKIKLIKIDIESFEYEAVLGSKDIFKTDLIENIALELHPEILITRKKPVGEIVDFLKSAGYSENKNYQNLVLSKTS